MPRTPDAENAVNEFAAKRVLLIAESPAWASLLRQALTRAGCRQVRTSNPMEGAEMALRGEFDTIIRIEDQSPPTISMQVRSSSSAGNQRYLLSDIIGVSASIEEARRRLLQVALVDAPVLITGETGTGKELFAQSLHGLSRRANGPFIAVNVSAVPESLLESELFGYAPGSFTGAKREGHKGKFLRANGGTLFLDEIGDLPLPLQAKLLRVLEAREVDRVGGDGPQPVDVRVISATHRSLPDMVKDGAFRADLFYRLNVLNIHVPPLRERPGDIEMLAERFLTELAERYGKAPPRLAFGARDRLRSYWWPGNVRELRNAMEHALAFADGPLILAEHLPGNLYDPQPAAASGRGDTLERERILKALKAVRGNKAEAARRLGISRSGLYAKLKEMGITL